MTGDIRFATISADGQFTCGTTADGAAYCWGENSLGQLGDWGYRTGVSRYTPGPVLSPFPAGAGAAQLAFTVQPSDVMVGQAFSVQVVVQDAAGVQVDAGGTVTLGWTVNNLTGATLTGTAIVNVVHGFANFTNLSLDPPGEYHLVASSAGLGGAMSVLFRVSQPAATLRWQARRWN